MFASSYLSDYAGVDDWVCIEDICCSYSPLIGRGYDCSAYWSPSRELLAFGNNWGDIPDMPAKKQPTEQQVWAWVHHHPGFLQRMLNAELARRAKRDLEYKRLGEFYTKFGVAEIHVVFRLPDGSIKEHEERCGIRSPLYMLPVVKDFMLSKLPPGTSIKKLTVYRRIPANRGEKKISTRKKVTPNEDTNNVVPRRGRKLRA